MTNNLISIMKVPFVRMDKSSLIEEIINTKINHDKHTFIVTANPEIIMAANRDAAYMKVLQSADYIVPDGIGVVKAAKWKGKPVAERIAGFDLMHDLFVVANEQGARCYFLGASEEVNKLAVENVQVQYPNLIVAGRHHGYFSIKDEEVVADVVKSKPDFVFVALGFPKQEKWIAMHRKRFEKGLFMGVGGSFDVLSGKVQRAPKTWINLHLEWLYRIIKQPFRWKRMLPIFKFMWLAFLRKV